MNIIITPKALDWFKKELDLQAGDAIRFFARYGGMQHRAKRIFSRHGKRRSDRAGCTNNGGWNYFFCRRSGYMVF